MIEKYDFFKGGPAGGKTSLISLVLAFVLCALSASVIAKESHARTDDLLRVCFEEWAPFMMRGPAVKNSGLDSPDPVPAEMGPAIEAMRTAGRIIGRDLEFTVVPYARCVRDVSLGRFDMMLTVGMGVGDLITSKVPLAFWSIGAVVRKGDEIARFQDMSQFNGRRVLLTHPFEYPHAVMDSQSSWESLEWIKLNADGGVREYSRPLRMIEEDRADVFFDDSFWARRVIADSNAQVRLLYPPVHTEPTYIGFAPGRGGLKKLFDRALADMIDTGLLDRIYEEGMSMKWRSLEGLTR